MPDDREVRLIEEAERLRAEKAALREAEIDAFRTRLTGLLLIHRALDTLYPNNSWRN